LPAGGCVEVAIRGPNLQNCEIVQTGTGKIVTWKSDKAYGFIRPVGGGKDLFVHLRDFGRLAREPRVGDVVTFQRVSDGAGRLRAADPAIRGLHRLPAGAPRARRTGRRGAVKGVSRPSWLGRTVVALLYFALLIYLAAQRRLSPFVPPAFVATSLVSLLMYAFDKSAAMNRRWRTSESTLLLASLLGGWPGALVAQGMFRHKSSKASFQVAFWLTVAIHCLAMAWWCWFRDAP
jgi:uncharacterized membrane protein YsdA (DUF1294 family)/cold shock CspA family protein